MSKGIHHASHDAKVYDVPVPKFSKFVLIHLYVPNDTSSGYRLFIYFCSRFFLFKQGSSLSIKTVFLRGPVQIDDYKYRGN